MDLLGSLMDLWEVARAEFAGHGAEIYADDDAFAVEAMAGEARGGSERVAVVGEVAAAIKARAEGFLEFFKGPDFDEQHGV